MPNGGKNNFFQFVELLLLGLFCDNKKGKSFLDGNQQKWFLPNNEETKSFKIWFYIKLYYKNDFIQRGLYRLGIQIEGLYSSQLFFSNYFASIISSHSFQLTPNSKTDFYNNFRVINMLAVEL